MRACREKLKNLQFGWCKFKSKSTRYKPGFAFPPDSDGVRYAAPIIRNGYVTDKTYQISDIFESVPDSEKQVSEVSALNKFNNKFKFSFK